MKYAVMILFLAAGISTAADDETSKKLLKDLEGSYKVTAAEALGKSPKSFLDTFEKISIKGAKFSVTFKVDNQLATEVASITVDAIKKPIHFDVKDDSGPSKGKTHLGIISLDGETIKICYNTSSAQKRPTEFKTTKNDEFVFLTLKRIKE